MKDIYDKALEKWGIEPQMLMLIEECSELQKAVAKIMRFKEFGKFDIHDHPDIHTRKLDLIDEIADVGIMMKQIIRYFNIESIVAERIKFKLDKLRMRIED